LLLIGFAGELAGFAGCVVSDTRSPAFAGEADEPAVLHQHFRPTLELRWKHREMVASLLKLPEVPAGENDGARRCAFGHRRVGVLEQQALVCNAIKRGRLDPWRAVNSSVGSPVIGDGEKNVRPSGRLGGSSEWQQD